MQQVPPSPPPILSSQLRLEEATLLRSEAEANLRLHLHISRQPDQAVAPMLEGQVDRVLALVAHSVPQQHVQVLQDGLREIQEAYTFGVKRASPHPLFHP